MIFDHFLYYIIRNHNGSAIKSLRQMHLWLFEFYVSIGGGNQIRSNNRNHTYSSKTKTVVQQDFIIIYLSLSVTGNCRINTKG